MALFSIFAYLGWQQFDWQIKRVQFKGVSSGTTILTAPGSKPDECSIITTDQIQQMFSNAGNAFAGANISVIGGRLCLPPKTTAELSSNALIVTCPFCEISFTLESSGGIHYGYPGILTDSSYPTLPNGEAAVETRVVGIRIETRYSALRAQHKDMKKYEDWSNRIVSGARDWFEWKEDVTPNVKPPAIQE
jgi:hypothetical protein